MTDSAANIDFDTAPARIDVTVPLTISLFGYGVDGTVVTSDSYGIANNGLFPVSVSSLAVTPQNGWTIKVPNFPVGADYRIDQNTLEAREVSIKLGDAQIGDTTGSTVTETVDWALGASGTLNPELQCYIGHRKNVDVPLEAVAAVAYTVGIPES